MKTNIAILKAPQSLGPELLDLGLAMPPHRQSQQAPHPMTWLLSGCYTFDKFVDGNQARKMTAQIIGMGSSWLA